MGGIRYEEVVDRTPVSRIIGGYLSAVAVFGGLVALFYYPGRVGTSAIVIGLIAAGIGSTSRRFTAIGVLVAGLGWFFGMVIAVALERPIF
ncbi:MAG: hypothetical protein U0R69_09215 [Gaiellales bacterium]